MLQQQMDGDDDAVALPPAAPPAPAPPVTQPLDWPDVVDGFLFLAHLRLGREKRSALLRVAGGLEFSRLEKVLRMSEVEHYAGQATRAVYGYHGQDLVPVPNDERRRRRLCLLGQ